MTINFNLFVFFVPLYALPASDWTKGGPSRGNRHSHGNPGCRMVKLTSYKSASKLWKENI